MGSVKCSLSVEVAKVLLLEQLVMMGNCSASNYSSTRTVQKQNSMHGAKSFRRLILKTISLKFMNKYSNLPLMAMNFPIS